MDKFQRSIAAAVGAFVLAAAWIQATPARADQPTYYEPPKFKFQVKPNYPDSARARHETGTVLVKVLVAANGTAKSIVIAKSSGHKDLDDEVLRVAKLSTYYPATKNDKPVTAFYDFTYDFTLAGLNETASNQSENAKKLAADPKNVGARLILIDGYLLKNNYQQAESLADDGVKLLPNGARLWAERGKAYYSDGSDIANNRITNDVAMAKLKTAVASYDQASKLDPKSATPSAVAAADAQYAYSLWQAQQFSDCLAYSTKAVQLSPKEWQYNMLKGDCESGLQNYKAAVADYQAAVALDDKKQATLTSRLLASLGQAQLYSGDEAAGLQSINQAERIAPSAIYAYQNLASYYITKGNLNAALTPLLQLAQAQPTNVQAQINIGDIYVQQNNFAAAQTAYKKAIEMAPKNGDAQFGLAQLAAAKGDTKSIDGPLQKAIALAPANAAVYNNVIAQALLKASTQKADLTPDAQKYADVATKTDPNYPDGWYSLGVAYADQGKKDQANSALRKAFDLFKAKNNQQGMQVVNKAFTDLNGKDNSLITGSGRSEKTNQPSSSGG